MVNQVRIGKRYRYNKDIVRVTRVTGPLFGIGRVVEFAVLDDQERVVAHHRATYKFFRAHAG